MADRFVYSNCIGAFLFDEKGEVEGKLLFPDLAEANKKLGENEWLEEEKKLIGNAKNGKVLFLGFKKEKIENVSLTQDVRKLETAEKALSEYNGKIARAIITIAKNSIKESVKDDELIAQAASTMEEVDKTLSLLTKRLREWHGLQNPEESFSVSDASMLVQAISGSNKSEMGAELGSDDKNEIKKLAETITSLLKLREEYEKYLGKKMQKECPNVLAVAGASIGAKLLVIAGSLKNLAMMPATTLQILGAERAMFNYLRKKSKKMPRFGILHEHKLISSANDRARGKIARTLADKISIAARVDYFKGRFVGDKLLKEVEAKAK